jgi:excisionase family DNA binding protein
MTTSLDPIELKVISEQVAEALKPLLVQHQGVSGKHGTDDEIMTVEGLAAFMKVPVRWVYVQVQNNTIPFTKAGKFLRFRKSLILKHLEQSSTPAAYPLRPRG